MSKIENDKYYTPIDIANHCWDKVFEIIGIENITEVIEPSCGNGAFYHYNKYVPDIGYDIEPECDYTGVKKADFLKANLLYKQGRLIIGNPPFGTHLHAAQQFYRKSIYIADYIAFILPISQLNNSTTFYQFDLLYSEDLLSQKYTDRELHCCFNIYRRPKCEIFNQKPVNKLNDISICRSDCADYEHFDFDIRMCVWGRKSGKILEDHKHYTKECKIKIHNDSLRNQIIEFLKTFDWETYLKNHVAMRAVQQYQIIEILKQNIQGIK